MLLNTNAAPTFCLVTANEVVTSLALWKLPLPAWLAANTTVPAPFKVTTLPTILAGPLFTLKTTGNLLVAAGTVVTVTVLLGA